MEHSFLGWVALIPLLFACSSSSPRRAAALGWIAGAVFFLGSLIWLRHVTWVGMIALALYCAIYFIPFSLFVSLRPGGWGEMKRFENILWAAGAAAVWAASEYVRATLLTGFPWNLLGVSQVSQVMLIQIADWGGVYALSALMVFVNVASGITILQYVKGHRSRGYRIHLELMCALFLVALSSSYGLRALLLERPAAAPKQVALLQPNIPEVGNWELADPELIYERLDELTQLVRRVPDLDLIIWPETALPDLVRYSPRSAAFVEELVGGGVPLLAGSMDMEWGEDGRQIFYNASMLFNPQGELLGIYRKQHLVLFGEYIPFDGKIPFINALTPIGSSFSPGSGTKLLRLPGSESPFSVLICFEDAVPHLARNAARAGATWLINQTNDSWFDPDSGSKQHLAQAVFRCVETRLPMLRCANTGVTCAIDSAGRITQTLAVRTEGFQTAGITPAAGDQAPTFYVRFGDLFAQTCLLLSVSLFIVLSLQNRKKTNA